MHKAYGLIFLIYTAVFLFAIILIPRKTFSEAENRYLSDFPKITIKTVFGGNFSDGIEDYFSDGFPLRLSMIKTRNTISLLAMQNEINGVYICKNEVCEAFTDTNEELTIQQADAINLFAMKSDTNVYAAIVPTKTAFSNSLPLFASNSDQKSFIEAFYASLCRIDCFDIYSAMAENTGRYIYYKTDHHWTATGAFVAYKKISAEMGLRSLSEDNYSVKVKSNNFLGTLYSKCLFNLDFDSILQYNYTNSLNMSLFRDGIFFESVYFDSFLEKKDKYSYYLGGNTGVMRIDSDCGVDKSLIIIGDSFSHCIAPFFATEYSKVYLVDLRYASVSDLRSIDADDILFLYNAKTLSEDTGILKLKYY